MVATIAVLVVIVIAACVVLSRVSIVGSTGLNPPKPVPEPEPLDPDGRRVSSDNQGLVDSWRVLGPVAIVCAGGCAVIAVSTFFPDPLVVPQAVVVLCAVAALPLTALSVATLKALKGKGRSVLSTMESVAPYAWPLAAIALGVFLLIALTGVGGPSGDPQVRDGRYVLNNHGVLTEISRDEYEKYEALSRRIVAGGIGGLYTPAIALGLYARRRSNVSRRSGMAPS